MGTAVWLSPVEALAFHWEQTGSSLGRGHSSPTSVFCSVLFLPLLSSVWVYPKVGLIFLFSRYQMYLICPHGLSSVSWKKQILLKIVLLGLMFSVGEQSEFVWAEAFKCETFF